MDRILKNTKEVQRGIEEMNGRVLRRLFPDTKEVLLHGNSSVVYEFDVFAKVWHELQVKGSFFILESAGGPEGGPGLSLVVLNRCSPEDFVHKISSADLLDFDSSFKFITIKAAKESSRIVGIWLSKMEDYQAAKELIRKRTASLGPKEKKLV